MEGNFVNGRGEFATTAIVALGIFVKESRKKARSKVGGGGGEERQKRVGLGEELQVADLCNSQS